MKHPNFSLELAGLLGLVLLAVAQGCSDDKDNDRPDPTIPIDTGGKSGGGKNSGGSKTDAGEDAGPEGGTGAVSNGGTGNVGNTGAESDAGTGNDAGSGPIEPPACTLPARGDNGCYNCPENGETVQWLNRCVSGSKCVEFDNDTRVPLAATVEIDVSLPALP